MPRRTRRSDKGPRIVQAAIRMFSQKGYHNTKISDIVQEAGVAQGTFYLYFPSKRDLLLSLVNDFHQSVTHMVSSHAARLTELDEVPPDIGRVVESNIQLLTEFFTYFREHKEIYRTVLLFASSADDEISRRVNESRSMIVNFTRNSIDFLIRKGVYRPMDSNLIAHASVSMVEGIAQRLLLDDNSTYDPAFLARELVHHELFGQLKR